MNVRQRVEITTNEQYVPCFKYLPELAEQNVFFYAQRFCTVTRANSHSQQNVTILGQTVDVINLCARNSGHHFEEQLFFKISS